MPYNTSLTPLQFAQYLRDMGPRTRDEQDYDLRGAWLAGARPGANDHFTDQFKKPNHPTFSQESQYSNPLHQGGRWAETPATGTDYSFVPSPQMYADPARMAALIKYLKGPAEGGRVLMVPPTLAAPAEE